VTSTIELGMNSTAKGDAARRPAPPLWSRFLIPSISDLIFVLLFASLTIGGLAPRLLGDAGTGWHIRDGELILQTHSITRADPFSATMNRQPWYAWEWLYDTIIAWVHHLAGLNGVVFVTALLIAFSFVLTLRLTWQRGGSLLISLVFLMLALGSSAIHLFARPHVVSWWLAVLWFQLLDRAETTADPSKARLFWLPLIMVLWANLHGGFVLGFALCGIYLLAASLRLIQTKNLSDRPGARTWLVRLTLATGLSFVAGLLNPFGYKLYTHVFQYLSDRFLMNHIDEFRSPDFHGLAQQCFAALLLLSIATLAAAGRKPRFSQLIVVLFAAYSGLYASRNLPVSSLLLTLILAPLLSQALADATADASIASLPRRYFSRLHTFSTRMADTQSALRGHLWPAAAVVVGMLMCASHGSLGSLHLMNAHFDAKRFPVAAVDTLRQRGIREPIFSQDDWGGYLIYRLYPQNRVFVDDRHDFYGDTFLKRYLRIIHVEAGWQSDLAVLDPNWMLLPQKSTLANILKEMPQWKLIYEDQTAALFEKATAEK